MLLACRQWDPLGLARRLPSLGVGAWRSAPLLPWRVQFPVRVCAALAAGSGGSGRCLVSCLPRFPLPGPHVPRCVWWAVPSGCPLPSVAGTPFHAVCAFRELGPVALPVVPACPFRVCALALPRCALPRPPLGIVACAPRAVPALGAGTAVPRGPCPSVCAAPVPCSVWRAWGGAARSWFPPNCLGVVRPPWGGSAHPSHACAAGRVGGGGGRPVRRDPRLCGPGGAVGRGVALPRSVPLPFLGRQLSGCHWRRCGHGGRGPHTAPVCARLPSLGTVRAASWRIGAGPPAPRGSRGSRRLGRGGRPCSGPSHGRSGPAGGKGGPSPLPRRCGGWRPCGLRAGERAGGVGGGGRAAAPLLPHWGRPAAPYAAPPLVVGAFPPDVRVRSGLRGRPVHRARPAWQGGGGEGRPMDCFPGGPFSNLPLPSPSGQPFGCHDHLVLGGAAPILFRCAASGRGPHAAPARCSGLAHRPQPPREQAAGGAGARGVQVQLRPPPPRSGPFWGRGGVPSAPGGWRAGAPADLKPGGEQGGGRGGFPAAPRPPSLPRVGLPSIPPGYTRAVGVAGRLWAWGAARSAANGSVPREGGGREGWSDLLAPVRAPAFPRPASEGAALFALSWAPPVRCRSVAGRAGA